MKRTVTPSTAASSLPVAEATVRGKGFKMSECKKVLKSPTEIQRVMGNFMWEEEWLDFARTVGGGSHGRQDASVLWDMLPPTPVWRGEVEVWRGSYSLPKQETSLVFGFAPLPLLPT